MWGMATTREAQVKRRPGRPPLAHGVTKRAPLSLRTTPKLKGQLKNRSDETGRSLTQEAEFCIEAWLTFEEVFGGPQMSPLLRLMAAAATLVEAEIGRGSMMTDYWTYSAVEQAWQGIIRSHRPLPNPEVVELLDEAVRLDKETPRPPEYPDFPIPQHLTGLGFFESEEQRHEHEARVREWEQQTAECRAQLAEHRQKIDTALSRFRHFEEIGRNAAKTIVGPKPGLVELLADAMNSTNSPASEDE
jgi:hypothetical protein